MDDATAVAVALISSRITAGLLPTIHVQELSVGPGPGRPCDGCDQPIGATEIEDEVDLAGGGMLRLHQHCFAIWQRVTRHPRQA